jgi:hypothetical protein
MVFLSDYRENINLCFTDESPSYFAIVVLISLKQFLWFEDELIGSSGQPRCSH